MYLHSPFSRIDIIHYTYVTVYHSADRHGLRLLKFFLFVQNSSHLTRIATCISIYQNIGLLLQNNSRRLSLHNSLINSINTLFIVICWFHSLKYNQINVWYDLVYKVSKGFSTFTKYNDYKEEEGPIFKWNQG